MASNVNKVKPKLFVNDLNVQRFCGILSSHYCWPQEYERKLNEESEPKCWSHLMSDSNEWFVLKLWPNVVNKLPLITANDKSVQQINELMFGLILKELDLMTFSQMQYFESILDLFNDEITFGVIFWLKICSQFNWRLIYAKQVVGHRSKHSKQLIQIIFNEIESKSNQKCFTYEEISYVYSIVDCICIQLLANNVVNGSSNDNQFLELIRSKCWDKLYDLNYDPFVRQLTAFNVLTQELIGFSFKLFRSDCLSDDIIENQMKEMEKLFLNTSKKMDLNLEIPLDIIEIREDIAFAKDMQKSIQLVDRQNFFDFNKSHMILDSLQEFFNLIENKTLDLLPSKRFSYLSDILREKQNPDFKQLIEILLSFADYQTFHSLLLSIKAEDIINNDFTLKLTKRVAQISKDLKTKTCFTTLLQKSLKMSSNIDLKSRLKHLKLIKISEPNTDIIKTLFNQITRDDMNSKLYEQLTHELLICIYLDPFPVFNMVIELALHHNRAQTGLVSKLICNNLYDLSTFSMNSVSNEKFILQFIVHLLMEKPSNQLVDDITRLVQQIVNCPVAEGLKPVLTFDEIFLYLIENHGIMKTEIIWAKIKFIKNLVELSGDQQWDAIQTNPVPTIVFLLQFLEYFWQNPIRKQLVIDILNIILDKKMTRNLTEEELTHLDEFLAKMFRFIPGNASNYKIYLAYCEKRFPKPIGEVIDITQNIYHDQILCYATITSDFMWICNIYTEYQLFCDQMKTALNYILPSLTTQEFYKLFKFLQMYYYNSNVVKHLRTAIFAIDRNIDKKPLISNLMDIVNKEVLTSMRSERLERPLTQEDYDYIQMDLILLFKSMATFDYQMMPNDLTLRLKDILCELAERMVLESINGYSLYEDLNKIPVTARQVIKQFFGEKSLLYVAHEEQVTQIRIPAGIHIQKTSIGS